jgi:hypothetical protein
MRTRTKVGTYKPKETNVEKLRVFLAKLNKNENGK